MLEQNLLDRFYPLIVVSCGEETQISRLIKRNNLTRDAALARLAAQMPTKEKIKFADFVIDTSGSIDNSIKQTEIIIQHLINLSNK
jgi:dephospho-CoA kinase